MDFTDMTLAWVNPDNGEIHTAEIFVTILSTSNYTYLEALTNQQLHDWIMLAFDFFGGVPQENTSSWEEVKRNERRLDGTLGALLALVQ